MIRLLPSAWLFICLFGIAASLCAAEPAAVVNLPKMDIKTWVPVRKVGQYRMEEPRFGEAAVVVAGKVYIIGGMDDNSVISDTIECFDPVTHSSTVVGKLKQARFFHGAAAVGSKIYIVGGQNNRRYMGKDVSSMVPFDVEPSVEIFDTKDGSLTAGPRMPTPRSSFACAAAGDKVYVIGGSTDDRRCTRRVDALVTSSLTWVDMPPMPTIRGGVAVVVPGDFIVVAGGYDGRIARNEVEAFNTRAGTWHKQAPLAEVVSAHSLVFFGKHLLFFGDYQHTNQITSYDLSSKVTEQFQLKYQAARHGAAVVVGDKILVFGGRVAKDSPGLDIVQEFEYLPQK